MDAAVPQARHLQTILLRVGGLVGSNDATIERSGCRSDTYFNMQYSTPSALLPVSLPISGSGTAVDEAPWERSTP